MTVLKALKIGWATWKLLMAVVGLILAIAG